MNELDPPKMPLPDGDLEGRIARLEEQIAAREAKTPEDDLELAQLRAQLEDYQKQLNG